MEKNTRLSWPVSAPHIQPNFLCSFSVYLLLDKPSGTTVNNPLLSWDSEWKRDTSLWMTERTAKIKMLVRIEFLAYISFRVWMDSVRGAMYSWVTRSGLTASFNNFDSLPSVTQVAGVPVEPAQYVATRKACVSRKSTTFSKQQHNSGACFWTWGLTAWRGQWTHPSFSQYWHFIPTNTQHRSLAGWQVGAQLLLQNLRLWQRNGKASTKAWKMMVSFAPPALQHALRADWRLPWWQRSQQCSAENRFDQDCSCWSQAASALIRAGVGTTVFQTDPFSLRFCGPQS